MSGIDLHPDIAEAAGRAVERIRTQGDRGATTITTEEAVAMAKAIYVLLIHTDRLERQLGIGAEEGETG